MPAELTSPLTVQATELQPGCGAVIVASEGIHTRSHNGQSGRGGRVKEDRGAQIHLGPPESQGSGGAVP